MRQVRLFLAEVELEYDWALPGWIEFAFELINVKCYSRKDQICSF